MKVLCTCHRSMRELESDISDIPQRMGSCTEQRLAALLQAKKTSLGTLLGVRAQGTLVRSLFQRLTQMNAPSKFFFGLERKNDLSGQELTDPGNIRC